MQTSGRPQGLASAPQKLDAPAHGVPMHRVIMRILPEAQATLAELRSAHAEVRMANP